MLTRLAAALSVVCVAAPVLAQGAVLRPSGQDLALLQQACAVDFLRLCPGVDPTNAAAEACFERNRARLSPPCSRAIQSYQQRTGAR